MGQTFGALAIPNGVFVDEAGVVRYVKLGGFSIDAPEDVRAIEGLLAAQAEDPIAQPPPKVADPVRQERAMEQFHAGQAAYCGGDRALALKRFRRALREDPDNLIVRKQIWVIEHPEKFYPEIDSEWQRQVYSRERAREQGAD